MPHRLMCGFLHRGWGAAQRTYGVSREENGTRPHSCIANARLQAPDDVGDEQPAPREPDPRVRLSAGPGAHQLRNEPRGKQADAGSRGEASGPGAATVQRCSYTPIWGRRQTGLSGKYGNRAGTHSRPPPLPTAPLAACLRALLPSCTSCCRELHRSHRNGGCS